MKARKYGPLFWESVRLEIFVKNLNFSNLLLLSSLGFFFTTSTFWRAVEKFVWEEWFCLFVFVVHVRRMVHGSIGGPNSFCLRGSELRPNCQERDCFTELRHSFIEEFEEALETTLDDVCGVSVDSCTFENVLPTLWHDGGCIWSDLLVGLILLIRFWSDEGMAGMELQQTHWRGF